MPNLFRLAIPALLLVGVAGCGAPRDIPLPEEVELRKAKEKEAAKDNSRGFVSEGGTLQRFNDKREKIWSIKWDSVELDIAEDLHEVGGTMKGVGGEFWRDGGRASTFIANNAGNAKGSQVLKLWGGVKVTSESPNTYIRCDSLVYDGSTGLMTASGNIEAVQGGLKFYGATKILADARLQQMGTPELFDFKAVGPPPSIGDVLKGKR
jgi:hypothetical protein